MRGLEDLNRPPINPLKRPSRAPSPTFPDTARKLVDAYLDDMGGVDMGWVRGPGERRLERAIARELRRAAGDGRGLVRKIRELTDRVNELRCRVAR